MSVCIPPNNKFNIKDNKIKIHKNKCNIVPINKRFSGTSKGSLYQYKQNGKCYVSYTEKFKIPKNSSTKFIKVNQTHLYTHGLDNLEELLREIQFNNKITKRNPRLAPKIQSVNFFVSNDKLSVQVLIESAYSNGYYKVGKFLDDKTYNLRFDGITVTNPVDKNLLKYIEDIANVNHKIKDLDYTFYARFLNPVYIKQNLKTWFNKNKIFFTAFFKDIHLLHKMDIYHHDLHFDNVWMNEKRQFKFIDLGRAATKKESLEINPKLTSKISKLRHADKRRIKRMKNKKKAMMLTELVYPDFLAIQGIDIGFEFGRHDIDRSIMINCFDRENIKNFSEVYYKKILLVYKDFLSDKYSRIV